MTMIQTIKDVDLMAAAVAFAPPITDGLVGWWYPGVNATIAAKDFTFTDNAAIVGSPTYDPAYVRCTGLSHYLQTALPETESYTILSVVRWPSGQTGDVRGCICGHWESGHSSKGLYSNAGTYPAVTLLFNAGKSAGASNTTLSISVSDGSAWCMVAATVDDATNAAALRNLTAGTVDTDTISGARVLDGDAAWRFGSFPFTWTGTLDVAHWSLWDRALTTDELATLRTFIAAFMLDRRSITI